MQPLKALQGMPSGCFFAKFSLVKISSKEA